jgi:hypothetical protein
VPLPTDDYGFIVCVRRGGGFGVVLGRRGIEEFLEWRLITNKAQPSDHALRKTYLTAHVRRHGGFDCDSTGRRISYAPDLRATHLNAYLLARDTTQAVFP